MLRLATPSSLHSVASAFAVGLAPAVRSEFRLTRDSFARRLSPQPRQHRRRRSQPTGVRDHALCAVVLPSLLQPVGSKLCQEHARQEVCRICACSRRMSALHDMLLRLRFVPGNTRCRPDAVLMRTSLDDSDTIGSQKQACTGKPAARAHPGAAAVRWQRGGSTTAAHAWRTPPQRAEAHRSGSLSAQLQPAYRAASWRPLRQQAQPPNPPLGPRRQPKVSEHGWHLTEWRPARAAAAPAESRRDTPRQPPETSRRLLPAARPRCAASAGGPPGQRRAAPGAQRLPAGKLLHCRPYQHPGTGPGPC